MPDERDTATGIALGATGMTILGGSFAASEAVTTYPLGAGQAGRYLLAASILTLLLRGRLGRLTREQLGWVAGTTAFGLVAFNVSVLGAVAHAEPGTVGAIVGASPVLLALAGPLGRGDRPTARVVGAAIVVAAGAAVVQQASGGSLTGLAFASGALVCEALFSLLAAPVVGALGPLRLAAWTCWLGTAGMATLIPLTGGVAMPTTPELLGLAYLAGPLTVVAFLLWYGCLARLSVERAGLLPGIVPVGALAGGLLTGVETADAGRLAGVALVAFGVVLGLRRPRPAARRRSTGAASVPTA